VSGSDRVIVLPGSTVSLIDDPVATAAGTDLITHPHNEQSEIDT